MVAHSAAFRHVFTRKIAAAEHGAFAYSVKRGGAGGCVHGAVLTVAVNRYYARSVGAVAQNMAESHL